MVKKIKHISARWKKRKEEEKVSLICECGGKYKKHHHNEHNKSAKHKKHMNISKHTHNQHRANNNIFIWFDISQKKYIKPTRRHSL